MGDWVERIEKKQGDVLDKLEFIGELRISWPKRKALLGESCRRKATERGLHVFTLANSVYSWSPLSASLRSAPLPEERLSSTDCS